MIISAVICNIARSQDNYIDNDFVCCCLDNYIGRNFECCRLDNYISNDYECCCLSIVV